MLATYQTKAQDRLGAPGRGEPFAWGGTLGRVTGQVVLEGKRRKFLGLNAGLDESDVLWFFYKVRSLEL